MEWGFNVWFPHRASSRCSPFRLCQKVMLRVCGAPLAWLTICLELNYLNRNHLSLFLMSAICPVKRPFAGSSSILSSCGSPSIREFSHFFLIICLWFTHISFVGVFIPHWLETRNSRATISGWLLALKPIWANRSPVSLKDMHQIYRELTGYHTKETWFKRFLQRIGSELLLTFNPSG